MRRFPLRVDIDPAIAGRLDEIAEELEPLLDRGKLSPANMIALLMDHWRGSPPRIEWMKNQAGLYPGKGRSKWLGGGS